MSAPTADVTCGSESEALAPGAILVAKESNGNRLLRVLWHDQGISEMHDDHIGQQAQIAAIDIIAEAAWPKCIPLPEAVQKLQHGIWTPHRGPDPFAFAFRNLGQIADHLRAAYIEHRLRVAKMVRHITANRPGCYQSKERARLVLESAKVNSASPTNVRKWLRFYWQSGEDENSLWPRHRFAGASSIDEALKSHEALEKRRGRRPMDADKLPPANPANGEEDLALPSRGRDLLILQGFDEYVKINHNKGLISAGKGIPWTDIHRYITKTYFEVRTRYLPSRRGKIEATVVPTREELLPSLKQVKRLIVKNRVMEKVVEDLEGTRRFNLLHRKRGGDPRRMAFGPGGLYQIDWMLADIYLVNRLTGMPCGRPYVFFVVDTFSRMIVGIHVTFDPPDYRSAAQALINTFTDKVAYAARFGVTLPPDAWKCAHLCWRLLADNGELARRDSDTIVEMLVSDLANTPPFRADLKALVESSFRCANVATIRFLPGMTRGPRERHAPDPRLQSQLNVIQFTAALIEWVVTVHNTRVIEKFPRTDLMAKFPVAATPNDLWDWGQEMFGHLRQMPAPEVKRRLMPVAHATVREDGIWFQSVCFLSEEPSVQKLVFKAAQHGNFDVRICYDPHDANAIELLPASPDGNTTRVPLADISAPQFANMTFREAAMQLEDAAALDRTRKRENERKRRDYRDRTRQLVAVAGSVQAAQHASLAHRNRLASLSDPKIERGLESKWMKQSDIAAIAPKRSKPKPTGLKQRPLSPDIRLRFSKERQTA